MGTSGVSRPIPVNEELTGIAIAAKTPGMVADEVLPVVPVTAEVYKWNEYPVEQGYTVPETLVGRTSQVRRVEFSATERDGSVVDHALEDPVPQTDQTAAQAGVDPKAIATELTSQLVTLAREIRVADLVFGIASYLPAQITAYGAGAGWGAGNPLEDLEEARDTMLVPPNTLTIGQDGWSLLRKNAFMVKAARPANTSGEGRLSLDEVKDVLEIENIIIGRAFVNYAKPGQAAQMRRTWAQNASLTYAERVMKSTRVMTFGWTARLGEKRTQEYFDPRAGINGSDVVRVGERLREQIVAKQAGWLFTGVHL